MTHDEAFLQAIIEDPDDDAPRLLYADWLEERGDPRGEFIRVQCALARMDEYDPRRWDLMAREKELLATHQREWLGPLRKVFEISTFRRGFLDRIVLDVPSFLGHAQALARLGPPPTVRLLGARNHVSALLSCPFLSRLKRLDFNCGDGVDFDGETLRASDVELLASSTVLAHLTSLSLKNNRIGPESVRLLTASSWITGLRELNLCSCEIGAAGVEALAECAALSLLERLDLSRNRLTAASTQALTGARSLSGLRRLHLEANEIDAAGMGELALNPRLASLEELNLSENPIGDVGLDRLIASPHLRRLIVLRLRRTLLGAGGVKALARAAFVPTLRHLDLSYNHLFSPGAALVAGSTFSRLEELNLAGNEIGDEGTKALAGSPHLAALKKLNLGVNGLRVWGLKAITTSDHLRNLRVLDLRSNVLGDMGLQVLARWERLRSLKALNLHGNRIGDLGASDFACSTYLDGLRDVNLSSNAIGAAAREALLASPLGKSRRVELDLSNNHIHGDESIPF